jgi:hypothetical protein
MQFKPLTVTLSVDLEREAGLRFVAECAELALRSTAATPARALAEFAQLFEASPKAKEWAAARGGPSSSEAAGSNGRDVTRPQSQATRPSVAATGGSDRAPMTAPIPPSRVESGSRASPLKPKEVGERAANAATPPSPSSIERSDEDESDAQTRPSARE